MFLDQEDIEFLSKLRLDGQPPRIFSNGMAQWDLPGHNYNYQCFQIVLEKGMKSPRVILQALKNDENGLNGYHQWIPLDSFPYERDVKLQHKIDRVLSRWAALAESFSHFLEARSEPERESSVREIIRDYFSIEDLSDRIDLGKITSFLALPQLRNIADEDSIEALGRTLSDMSRNKKKDLTYNWLAGTLGA